MKKLEGLPALRRAQPGNAITHLLVLLKLRKGSDVPDYVEARGEPAPGFCSAVVSEDQLARLNDDPAIESFTVSRALPAVE
ncbi:hypothetical protein [Sphingomonas sp. VNH70]|uniref:hypothetical protein n=1 Tax=Sphingomonas silueang TaxID=3156617 RepID=UPI0032B39C59